MTEVYRRKLALDKYTPTLTAVTLFYSRIILKKLTTENKTIFRKLEKSVKFCVKCDADIKFINFSIPSHKFVLKEIWFQFFPRKASKNVFKLPCS